MKTQGPQALEVRRQLPRLSLLKRPREKIFIYSTVCQCGRPLGKSFNRVGCGLIRCVGVRGFGGRRRDVNETEDGRCTFGEMQVRATEKTGLDVTTLLRSLDQTRGFEVLEAAIEGALRLHRSHSEKLATGEDVTVWVRRIDGAGQGRENCAGAGRDAIKARRAMNRPQNDPRQIGGVADELDACLCVAVSGLFFMCGRANATLASNRVLRDRHV
jgi:hypothetical protein